jgi:hypothetical protein
MKPLEINLTELDWTTLLKRNIQEGIPVDLDNFDYKVDGQFCESVAIAHGMQLRLDSKHKLGLFRIRARRSARGD